MSESGKEKEDQIRRIKEIEESDSWKAYKAKQKLEEENRKRILKEVPGPDKNPEYRRDEQERAKGSGHGDYWDKKLAEEKEQRRKAA